MRRKSARSGPRRGGGLPCNWKQKLEVACRWCSCKRNGTISNNVSNTALVNRRAVRVEFWQKTTGRLCKFSAVRRPKWFGVQRMRADCPHPNASNWYPPRRFCGSDEKAVLQREVLLLQKEKLQLDIGLLQREFVQKQDVGTQTDTQYACSYLSMLFN